MLFRSNDTATTEIYTSVHTLSLHDALPTWSRADAVAAQPVNPLALAQTAAELLRRRMSMTASSA